MRTEPALVVGSVVVAYLLARVEWRERVVLIALLVASFGGTSVVWERYWGHKIEGAKGIVERAGGMALPSLRNTHHSMWHPLWCGLGDFGSDRGYAWDDFAAHRFAIPRVNRRHGTRYVLSKGRYALHNRDPSSPHYYLRPETLPEYTAELREKILGDIRDDPLWYPNIIRQRVLRVLEETTPVRLQLGLHFVDVPFTGWAFLPVLACALIARRREQFVLLAFYGPASATALLVHSGSGTPCNSAYHLVTFAVLGCWGVHALTHFVARARRV